MTIGFSTTLRTNRAAQIRLLLDGGPAAGKIKFYSGARPATGAAITAQVLLATLNLSDPCGAEANGVLTLGAVADGIGTAGSGAGTAATWARLEDSTGAFVTDVSVTATGGGGDVQMGSVIVATGQIVSVTSAAFTEGNA
jgi:hypothetical protein